MNPLRVIDVSADRVEGEVVVAFFFADERPLCGPAALLDWRLNGMLTDLLIAGRAVGYAGEQILIRSNGKIAAERILFVGGGNRQGLNRDGYRGLVSHMLETCRSAGFARLVLGVTPVAGVEEKELTAFVADIRREMPGRAPECLLSISC